MIKLIRPFRTIAAVAVTALALVSCAAARDDGSALRQLRSLAGNSAAPSVILPAPSAQVPGPSSEEWLKAAQLYSDEAFAPKPQRRVDSGPDGMIMLQGFHWYADAYWHHPADGWWGVLKDKAPEIAKDGFGMVWLPPVSIGGYYPTEWYNLDSQWGKKGVLLEAIKAMHSNGVLAIGDVVLNHRNGTKNWADFTGPDWPTSVIVSDDEWPGVSGAPHNGKGSSSDEGQGESGCRDLDHRNPLVRRDTKIFMRWLRNTVGFDGWRYDMVKGYAPSHIKEYNAASEPVFTVGEVYDGSRQVVADWIDGTDDTQGKAGASSAFDFPTRFNLVSAVENSRYELLSDNGKPSGLIGWWPEKAVTFVENHDTSPRDPNFIAGASAEYKAQRLMGYAYILTHPGVPCVFWPHFFDWGKDYQDRILALMNIRKASGISSAGPAQVAAAGGELYAAIITGKNQRVAVKLGRNDWNPGPGWTLAADGERYAVWTQPLAK